MNRKKSIKASIGHHLRVASPDSIGYEKLRMLVGQHRLIPSHAEMLNCLREMENAKQVTVQPELFGNRKRYFWKPSKSRWNLF